MSWDPVVNEAIGVHLINQGPHSNRARALETRGMTREQIHAALHPPLPASIANHHSIAHPTADLKTWDPARRARVGIKLITMAKPEQYARG